MNSDFAEKLAGVIVNYSVEVQPGDYVGIVGQEAGRPLFDALYKAVLERGGHPRVVAERQDLIEWKVRYGDQQQIEFSDPIDELLYGQVDVLLRVAAPENVKRFADVPAERVAMRNRALGTRLNLLMERLGQKTMRYCMIAWPTESGAQQTGMGYYGYRDLLYRAGGLDQEDPVGHWQQVARRQQTLVDWLAAKESVVVEGPGVDLRFSLTGRQWVNAHGKLNFPDGEIFTGPVEDSVEGEINFNMPSLTYGQEVRGARLVFEGGRAVEVQAEVGESFLQSQLGLDEGASRMGEFAIGTNWGVDRVTGSTLLDEKIGGTIHLAMGKSIVETGGQNQSQIHWDMVHDMKGGGRIMVDDELFYDSGEFVI